MSEVSFSYWEKLGGANRSIIADSAIPNRFHLFTTPTDDDKEFYHNYSIIDQGELVFSAPQGLPPNFVKDIPEVLRFYEGIREIDGFDPNHCPVVEFQTDKQKNWFLQYHRSRDLEPSSFVLDRKPNENELEAIFVRGTTPPEGIISEIEVYWGWPDELGEKGSAGLDIHYNFTFSEIMSRRRQLEVHYENDINWMAVKTYDVHLPKSKLFNPEVTVVIPNGDKFNEVMEKVREKQEGKIGKFKLKVVSDGRRAFIEFL